VAASDLVRPGGGPRQEIFSDFFYWPAIKLFGLLYLVGISNGIVMTLVLIGLLVWSLKGPTQAIMAMSLVAMYKFSNGAVASFSPAATVLFWAIAMAASARLFIAARRVNPPFVFAFAFATFAAVVSLAVSKAPDVSVLKAVSFFMVSGGLLLASQSLKVSEVLWLQRWFFSLALVMAVLSLLTVPFPSIGFRKVAGSLQGMFGHPQSAGVFYAPFAAWFIARVFVEPVGRLPRWVPLMAVLFAGMIIASSTRTAMLATFVAVATTLVVVLVKGRVAPTTRTRGQIMGFTAVLGALSLIIIFSGVLQEELESIAFKGDDTESLGEAFASARGNGVAQHIENFLDAPLTGHGFGVYRHGVRWDEKRIKRFMGIPLSASTEKGIAFTAVLEEVGIFGALLFYALLIAIIRAMTRGTSLGALAMVMAAIAANFGEAVIFATAGMGLFLWLIIGFGLARARVRLLRS
jgi:hypothetical protein